jgi:ubiquinone/menaquinone biosynthesis C-methylase UbiE
VRVDDVAIDVVGDAPGRESWGARAMRSRWLARLYEAWWRPLTFGLSTSFTAPSAESEATTVVGLLAGRPEPWLDLSCGPGAHLASFLCPAWPRQGMRAGGAARAVFGVDLSRPMLERAREAAPTATLVRADAADLPFDDGVFGAVANLAALDLYPDPPRVVREAARVLAPGGRWVCSTFVRAAGRKARSPLAFASGVRTPSMGELARWAQEAGLGPIRHIPFRGYSIAWADRQGASGQD